MAVSGHVPRAVSAEIHFAVRRRALCIKSPRIRAPLCQHQLDLAGFIASDIAAVLLIHSIQQQLAAVLLLISPDICQNPIRRCQICVHHLHEPFDPNHLNQSLVRYRLDRRTIRHKLRFSALCGARKSLFNSRIMSFTAAGRPTATFSVRLSIILQIRNVTQFHGRIAMRNHTGIFQIYYTARQYRNARTLLDCCRNSRKRDIPGRDHTRTATRCRFHRTVAQIDHASKVQRRCRCRIFSRSRQIDLFPVDRSSVRRCNATGISSHHSNR